MGIWWHLGQFYGENPKGGVMGGPACATRDMEAWSTGEF